MPGGSSKSLSNSSTFYDLALNRMSGHKHAQRSRSAPVKQQPQSFKHNLPEAESGHGCYHSYIEDDKQDKGKRITADALRRASVNMQIKAAPTFKDGKELDPLTHYKDKNCEVQGQQLVVERYWWPFWFSYREFDLTDVKAVWYDAMDEIIGSTWGLGDHCTYWPLKCCRECSSSKTDYNVVFKYDDEILLKGLTVQDIDTFLTVISQNLMPSVPIIKGIPTKTYK